MKRLILSTLVVLLGAATLAPAGFAQRRQVRQIPSGFSRQQVSTPSQLSEGATITDLVRYNRDARSKR
ncbi:MAG: hypothetical protein ACR2FS_05335 [Phormidesmis sp.]